MRPAKNVVCFSILRNCKKKTNQVYLCAHAMAKFLLFVCFGPILRAVQAAFVRLHSIQRFGFERLWFIGAHHVAECQCRNWHLHETKCRIWNRRFQMETQCGAQFHPFDRRLRRLRLSFCRIQAQIAQAKSFLRDWNGAAKPMTSWFTEELWRASLSHKKMHGFLFTASNASVKTITKSWTANKATPKGL